MKKKFEVKTYKTILCCDQCGKEMVRGKMGLPTHPPKYLYECESCSITVISEEFFPSLSHEDIEEAGE